MKKIAIFLLILSLSLLAACGSNGTGSSEKSSSSDGNGTDTYTFKVGTIVSESHILSESIDVFKEELEKRSDGRFTVEYYPNATLGGEAEMLQQLQSGTLDLMWMSVAELSKSAEAMNFWSTPFMIESYDHLYEIASTEEAMDLFDGLEKAHPLGVVAVGMRHVLAKDDSVQTLSDIKGKKIRIPASNINIDWWESLGAVPTPVALPELYTSFQTGVVDMLDIDLDAIVHQKYDEVGKNLTPLNHMIMAGGVIMSEVTWNQLSDEDKKMIEEAFEVSREFNRDRSKEKEEENLNKFLENGGNVVEFEEEDQLIKVAEEINEKYASENEKIKAIMDRVKEMK